MALIQLEVSQFRCIHQAVLQLDPRQNLIVGPNASGKTSLLEAIFLLGRGDSFRSHHTERMIQHGTDHFLTVGRLNGKHGEEVIGLKGSRGEKEGRVNGQATRSLAELAARFPVQSIDPDVHELLEDGPTRRRQFLDWGVFHVEHQFHDAWRRYQRALKQRNATLKANQPDSMVRVWDQDLIEQGQRVTLFREQYLQQLRPFVHDLGTRLLGLELDLDYQPGWRRALSLPEALVESTTRDRERGNTCVGPHRADLQVKVDALPAKDRISRGQQKLLACTLILAQQLHRAAIDAPPACLLIDDPAAELDVDNLGKLLAVVADIPTQLVITGLNQDVLSFFPHARMFHVEHGVVKPMA